MNTEDRIERVAEVVDKAMDSPEWRFAEEPGTEGVIIARALEDANLLAPQTEPRSLFRAVSPDGTVRITTSILRLALEACGPDDRVEQAYVAQVYQWRPVDGNPVEVCVDHRPTQYRDGKPPWCPECGLTANGKKPVSRLKGAQ